MILGRLCDHPDQKGTAEGRDVISEALGHSFLELNHHALRKRRQPVRAPHGEDPRSPGP